MADIPALVTIAQLDEMPDDGQRYELHYGELVRVAHPIWKRYQMREHLEDVLDARLPQSWHACMEFPYRPLPDFEFRFAHVAVVSKSRWDATDLDDNLRGGPELVIEIDPQPDRKTDLMRLASLCLATGAIQFWVLDMDRTSVTVMYRDGSTTVYTAGQSIPLESFDAEPLPVDEIFNYLPL